MFEKKKYWLFIKKQIEKNFDYFDIVNVWVKKESVISNNLQSIFLIILSAKEGGPTLLQMERGARNVKLFNFSTAFT